MSKGKPCLICTLEEFNAKDYCLSRNSFAKVWWVVGLEPLRAQYLALEAAETNLELPGKVLARLDDVLIWKPSGSANDAQEHQRALYQATLRPKLTGTVHANSRIYYLVAQRGSENL